MTTHLNTSVLQKEMTVLPRYASVMKIQPGQFFFVKSYLSHREGGFASKRARFKQRCDIKIAQAFYFFYILERRQCCQVKAAFSLAEYTIDACLKQCDCFGYTSACFAYLHALVREINWECWKKNC